MKSLTKLLAIPACILFAACGSGNSDTTTDSTSTATADTSSKTVQNNNIAEQDFVNYAVPGNTKEIIWLKAGIAKSKNKEIKKHATMMLADHEKLDATVKAYLGNHSSLSVPTVDTSNVVNINDKKGSAWDSAWTNKMVEDHGELLTKLENSQRNVKDTALLSIINSTIPVVESHLAMVKAVKVSGK